MTLRISSKWLKQYNKILNDQLDSVKAEIYQIEQILKIQINWDMPKRLTPKQLLLKLGRDTVGLRADVIDIARKLERHADSGQFKAWLKTYKIPPEPFYDDLDLFDDMPPLLPIRRIHHAIMPE